MTCHSDKAPRQVGKSVKGLTLSEQRNICVLCDSNEAPAAGQACPFCACRRFLEWDELIDAVEMAWSLAVADAALERMDDAIVAAVAAMRGDE